MLDPVVVFKNHLAAFEAGRLAPSPRGAAPVTLNARIIFDTFEKGETIARVWEDMMYKYLTVHQCLNIQLMRHVSIAAKATLKKAFIKEITILNNLISQSDETSNRV